MPRAATKGSGKAPRGTAPAAAPAAEPPPEIAALEILKPTASCKHTLNHLDPTGSWVVVTHRGAKKVICLHCNKFYGGVS